MREEMEVLVDKFRDSDLMKDHQVPRKLLTDIHDHLKGSDGGPLKEAELLPSAIAKRLGDKERTVSVQAVTLRNLIETYFDKTSEGVSWGGRLRLRDKAPYLLEVDDNVPHPYDMRFWRFYVPNDKSSLPTCTLATSVLFLFSPKERCFFRYLDLNSKSREPKDAVEALSGIENTSRVRSLRRAIARGDLIPCFHYLPFGETKATNLLREWFDSKGKAMEVKFSKDVDHDAVWNKHIICLGNSRTSWCVRDYQEGLRFRHSKKGVEDHNGRSGSRITAGPRFQDSYKEAFVLVTRRPNSGAKEGGMVTLVATHNTPALAAVVKHLTDESDLKRLWADMGFLDGALPPANFQIVFRVQMKNFEQTEGVEVVDRDERPAPKTKQVA